MEKADMRKGMLLKGKIGAEEIRVESHGSSDRKMSEFVTTSESRIVTAHGIFNSNEEKKVKIYLLF